MRIRVFSPPSKDFLSLKQLFQFLSTKILGGNMQKTVIACCVGALFAAGTAAAATHEQDGKTGIAGEGSALTVNTQTQNVTDKSQLIGGWWHYTDLVTAETDLNHAGSTSDLTVDLTNEKQVDEIVGGNYIKQPTGLADKTHEATIGDTKLTVKAVKTEYIVAGSKANNMGKGSIVNGNTTLVIEDVFIEYAADPSKGAVVGGNYIKASSPSAGMVSQTNSTVGDTSVTINGGTVKGSVYGSSFAENYTHVDTPDMQLKLTTGNSSLQINGGTPCRGRQRRHGTGNFLHGSIRRRYDQCSQEQDRHPREQ